MPIPTPIFHRRLEAPFHALEIRHAREAQLDYCVRLGVSEQLGWDLAAITDELATNIMLHSQATWMEWSLSRDPEEGLLLLRFHDNGSRFDPVTKVLPARVSGFEGKMGLAMVRRLTRGMRYKREDPHINSLELQLGPQPRLSLA
jgi:anti-sigma regulatory factor (Ser/Thr protein kinase)